MDPGVVCMYIPFHDAARLPSPFLCCSRELSSSPGSPSFLGASRGTWNNYLTISISEYSLHVNCITNWFLDVTRTSWYAASLSRSLLSSLLRSYTSSSSSSRSRFFSSLVLSLHNTFILVSFKYYLKVEKEKKGGKSHAFIYLAALLVNLVPLTF